jgi:predicted transcriptional regulator YheO
MKKQDEIKIIMNSYLSIMEFLSEILGSSCEIILHSIEGDNVSIVKINNGKISNRKIGTEHNVIGYKHKAMFKDNNFIANNFYRSENGIDIKSNTFYIKDSSGELIGMLCLNFDITASKNVKKILDEFLGNVTSNSTLASITPFNSIKDFTIKTIEEVIEEAKIPVERMTSKEKIEILKVLIEREVFRTKGAVRIVAKHLKTSETSLYRYLKELQ